VADLFNSRLRYISVKDTTVSTIAQFSTGYVTLDAAGVIYVDGENLTTVVENRVRKLTKSNKLNTPKIVIKPSAKLRICERDTLVLFAKNGNGTGYLWSTGATGDSIVVRAVLGADSIYSVRATIGAACLSDSSAPDTVKVIRAPIAPRVTAVPSTPVCQGDSIMLSVPTAFAYYWSTGETTRTIYVKSSGTYFAYVGNSSGCSSVGGSITVIVNPAGNPIITPSGPTTFCQGDSVTLSLPSSSVYLWNTGATTRSIVVKSTGNYSARVTSLAGCPGPLSSFTKVKVNALPATPAITASGPIRFCQGDSVTLSTNAVSPHFRWSNGDTTRSIKVKASGTYFVQVKDTNSCFSVASASKVVIVDTIPAKPVVAASGPLDTFDPGHRTAFS
jgi:hypothetical protein